MVNGPSPGPAPAAQAPASNCRLTRSSWRTWPHRKLRRKVPRVDGALITQPRRDRFPQCAARRRRRCSRHRPDADATRVSTLSPTLARPGAPTQVNMAVHQLAQSQMAAQRNRQEQPSIGHQAVIVEGDVDAVGLLHLLASFGCSSPGTGFMCQKPLSPKPGALSYPFTTPPHSSFRWWGFDGFLSPTSIRKRR